MLEAINYHYDFTFGNKLPLLLPPGWVVEVPLQLLHVELDDANSLVLPVGRVVEVGEEGMR